jgi:hypothetical protein
MRIYQKAIGVVVMLTALYGCGGGGGDSSSGGQVADSYVFPAGKATLTFSAMSTAQLSAPISGLDFSLVMPQGMSVTTANGTSGQIDGTTVTPGSALTGTSLAFGSYSTSTRKAHLGMTTTSDKYRVGEFLRLVCTIAPNKSISLGDLKTANSPVVIIKTVGYDSATSSTVQLTDKVKVTIGAVR